MRDQAACGSCVSFATCGATESRALIKQKNPGREFDLSEAHLFYCGAGMACDTGWFSDDVLKFATNTGIGKEADFPYTPAIRPDDRSSRLCASRRTPLPPRRCPARRRSCMAR